MEINNIDLICSLVRKIMQGDLPEHVLNKIHNLANKDNVKIQELIDHLTENHTAVPEIVWNSLLDFLYTLDNETLHIVFDIFSVNKNNIEDFIVHDIRIANKFAYINLGIPELVTSFVYETKWQAIGKGELLASLILQDATMTPHHEKGDLIVGPYTVEVKAKDARLAGNKGFGSASEVAKYWHTELRSLAIECGIIHLIPKEHISEDPKKWNMANEDYAKVYYHIFNNNVNTLLWLDKYADIISNGWKQLFLMHDFIDVDISFNEIRNIIIKGFNSSEYEKQLLLINMKYYLDIQYIDKLFLTNEQEFMIIDRSALNVKFDIFYEFADKYIKYNKPGFSHAVGQGKVFGITLK